ncbi:MAG: hypothetical protein UR66_C0005G0076 [Candidatus Moranbacteria bacterium GW2011_GWE1_35_17]|nr:MAG: hypothetical protein UR66_C0005G0076 [Candidatus Moranbacteria bacterium GW2011_GWE1_35_17]KKP80934.1 MAG: hypothetical protein UR82_C0077G0001 [Candidatus Moranbacteria bacterium GW2011_GWF1_35_5]KKP81473.1 MAG: hypothetical protein UR83_C0075G0005 [Candidatus Moranbacteria bacterium GW2011_GWF2_35_54]
MGKNKKVVLAGLILAFAIATGSYSLASAYRGDYTQKGPNYSPERHALMQKAFETNDYNLWKSQMDGRGATRVINESNFSKFAQAHNLALAGNYAEANKIRTELGLGNGNGTGSGGRGAHCLYNN